MSAALEARGAGSASEAGRRAADEADREEGADGEAARARPAARFRARAATLLAAALAWLPLGAAAQPAVEAEEKKRTGFSVTPKAELENWVISQSHPFFGATSRTWAESIGRFGLVVEAPPYPFGTLSGRAGVIGVKTSGDDPYGTGSRPVDAPPGSHGRSVAPDFEVDQAWIRVTDPAGLPVEITLGRQEIRVGTQFLFGDGVLDGFLPSTMQGAWVSPRRAFDALRVRSTIGGFALDGFAYRVDPTWSSGFDDDGLLGGLEVSRPVEWTGGTYAAGIFHRSTHRSHDNDMQIYDFRGEQPLPLPWISGTYVSGEIVTQIGKCRSAFYCTNPPEQNMTEHGYHVETGIRPDEVAYRPFFEVGYAYFSPDFSPVAFGFHDWGKWYLGNQIDWFLYETNSRVIRTDLGFWPREDLQVRMQYFNTRQTRPTGTSDGGTLTDEFTWIASWTPVPWLWWTVAVGYSIPREAFGETGMVNPFSAMNTGATGTGDYASLDLVTGFAVVY